MAIFKVGEKIDLRLRLATGETDKFVRAKLFEPDNTPFAGSPVGMLHIDGGTYGDSSLTMPDLRSLTVNYDVFEDAGFTVSSNIYPEVEIIERQEPIDVINNIVEQKLRTTIKTEETALKTSVSPEGDLCASVSEEAQLQATVKSDGAEEIICASVSPEVTLQAQLGCDDTTAAAAAIEAAEFMLVTGMVSDEVVTVPALKAWAYKDNNRLVLADSDATPGDTNEYFDFAGINPASVPAGGTFNLISQGRVPNALLGKGYPAGTRVFLDQTPGELTDSPDTGNPAVVEVFIGKAIPAVGAGTGDEAKDLLVQHLIEA